DARNVGLLDDLEGSGGVAAQQVVQARVAFRPHREAVERGGQPAPVGVAGVEVGGRGRAREREAQAVLAGVLGRGGQREPVAVPQVVQLELAHGHAVEADLHRLALHAAEGRQLQDGGPRRRLRPGQGQLGLVPGPDETLARLPIEAVGLVRLRRGRPEQDDVARRPAIGEGQPAGQVVGELATGGRTAETRHGQDGGQRRRRRAPQRGRYLILVPGGTSPSNVQRTALPSSDAASTMPLLSTPMSFAGLRFATTATVLPGSDSGAYASAMPATNCRTSPPRSTMSFTSFFEPGTFSADWMRPTRSSTLAKSAMSSFSATGGGAACVVSAGGGVSGGLLSDTVLSFSMRGNSGSTARSGEPGS